MGPPGGTAPCDAGGGGRPAWAAPRPLRPLTPTLSRREREPKRTAAGSGPLQGARTLAALFGLGGRGLLQLEVELQFGEAAALHATVTGGCGVLDELDVADQAIAGGVGEVVPQVLLAGQVDLGGQVAVARGGDKEVDMCRALAVAAKQVQAFLGRAIRGAAITARHNAAGAIAALGIGDDAPAQVVVALALIEVGVVALGV